MTQETISKIVKASGVQSGELILIHFWGEDSEKGTANRFMTAVAQQGATPILQQQSRSLNREIFLAADENCFGEKYFELFTKFDAVLDIFTYQPVILGYEIDREHFELYRRYMAQLFEKLTACKRFTQIRIPTAANAEESGLEPQDYMERMERAYDIDYDALKEACGKEMERFSGMDGTRLLSGEDCVLSFELKGRTWHMDTGDGDLPCGEIYIAPQEEKTQGNVWFETLYLDEKKYRNVVLEIKDGMVCGSSGPEVAEFFVKQPRENRVVCELGFGMNKNVTNLCGYTVLDEKMYGTFHIAVGANHMFGGKNMASCHIDFVGHGEIIF